MGKRRLGPVGPEVSATGLGWMVTLEDERATAREPQGMQTVNL